MPRVYASIEQIQVIKTVGPFRTKSAGVLNVRLAVPFVRLPQSFFVYDEEALARAPIDLRGLRLYTVTELMRGAEGGGEFHEIRTEFVIVVRGTIRWMCEDLARGKREFVLTQNEAILMPPHICHHYRVDADHSELMIIANTLFDPADPRTHDTYSAEVFHSLQGPQAA
ncbi:MAG: WxcM-like domain-containing protein [bacterium]|nr:WxcM-like domain-containing protein [bacterium]